MTEPACAIVFTDIVGFTQFTAECGDEAALRVLERQDVIVRKLLPEPARVVKELGDGMLLWFPEARAAIDTCLALQDCFATETRSELPLWVRMGMHWGCPRRRGDDLVGHAVNLASRIAETAGPGEVVVSDAVHDAIGGERAGFAFHELGPVFVKGVVDPVRLYRVVGA
jgi:adenylate cyclase